MRTFITCAFRQTAAFWNQTLCTLFPSSWNSVNRHNPHAVCEAPLEVRDRLQGWDAVWEKEREEGGGDFQTRCSQNLFSHEAGHNDSLLPNISQHCLHSCFDVTTRENIKHDSRTLHSDLENAVCQISEKIHLRGQRSTNSRKTKDVFEDRCWPQSLVISL